MELTALALGRPAFLPGEPQMLPKKPAALSSPMKGHVSATWGERGAGALAIPPQEPHASASHAGCPGPAEAGEDGCPRPSHGIRRATRMNPVDPRCTSSVETAVLRAATSWRQETRERCDWGFPAEWRVRVALSATGGRECTSHQRTGPDPGKDRTGTVRSLSFPD